MLNKNEKIIGKNNVDSNGFTIIEVLIGLAIFSIGILAVAGLQVSTSTRNANSRFATEAAFLAQNQVERLMLLPYDPTLTEFSTVFNNGSRAYTDVTGRYLVDWTVSPPGVPLDNTVTVTVSVSWTAKGEDPIYRISFLKIAES
jgi:prepilin-type N-terminal cleavage/methylation domain-containing protein